MGTLKRGSVRRYKRPSKFTKAATNQLENQAVTRVGKQAKQGAKKSTSPGGHWNQIKR